MAVSLVLLSLWTYSIKIDSNTGCILFSLYLKVQLVQMLSSFFTQVSTESREGI